MRQVIFVVSIFLILAGCIAPGAIEPPKAIEPISRVPFMEDEYKVLSSSGTATVRGQAFLKTRAGDVKTAAGNKAMLNPVTSYSTQWYEIHCLQETPLNLERADQRIWQYIKETIADGDGRFTFKNVPAGDYYVTTGVFWEAPVFVNPWYIPLRPQGGVVTKKITVRDGDDIEVILTHSSSCAKALR